MKHYKEMYEHYEGNHNLHKIIPEVEDVEHEVNAFLDKITYCDLVKEINSMLGNENDLIDELDRLLGKIARAYEMQGFTFGYDLAADKEV